MVYLYLVLFECRDETKRYVVTEFSLSDSISCGGPSFLPITQLQNLHLSLEFVHFIVIWKKKISYLRS